MSCASRGRRTGWAGKDGGAAGRGWGLSAHPQPVPTASSDGFPPCSGSLHTRHDLTHLRGTRIPPGRTGWGAASYSSPHGPLGVQWAALLLLASLLVPVTGAGSRGPHHALPAPQVRAFLQPPLKGVVMETFGSGNGPTKPDLLWELRAATERGLIILNCTHCLQGTVTSDYATGMVGVGDGGCRGRAPHTPFPTHVPSPQATVGAGIVSGFDMTSEAALAKLSYVLGQPSLSLHSRKEVRALRAVGMVLEHVSVGSCGRVGV